MGGFLYYLALVLGLVAFALLGPAVIGILAGEGEVATRFLVMAGLSGFVAGAVFFALQGRDHRLPRVGSYVLALVLWIVPSLAAAVPFMAAGDINYVSALFEAVSGFTTTGATVFPSIDSLPLSLIFWRAELQWLGGLITLIMIVSILGPAGLGGLPSSRLGLVETVRGRRTLHSLTSMRGIVGAYATLTGACILLLALSGIPLFDAVCLGFSTVSTGGFVPRDGGLAAYDNGLASVVLAVFMLIAATSILWQRMVLRGHRAELIAHRESYWVIGIALGLGLIYTLLFKSGVGVIEPVSLGVAIRDGFLTGISLVSTTGFAPHDHAFAVIPLPLALVLALAGGAAFSTAGGLKYYRIGAMFVQAAEELRRLIHPHAVRASRFGSQPYDMTMMKAIWSHFVASIIVIIAASLLFALENIDYEGALLVAVAAFSNVGGLYDSAWADGQNWPAYAEFADGTKLIAIAAMILGRVEIIALFGAMSVLYWRS